MKKGEKTIEEVYVEFKLYEGKMCSLVRDLAKLQKENSTAIGALTESTKDLVDIYNDAQGAVRFAGLVGRIIKWLTGLTIISVGFKWIVEGITKG